MLFFYFKYISYKNLDPVLSIKYVDADRNVPKLIIGITLPFVLNMIQHQCLTHLETIGFSFMFVICFSLTDDDLNNKNHFGHGVHPQRILGGIQNTLNVLTCKTIVENIV